MIDLWCTAQQMFWMILSFVTKVFNNLLVLKIFFKGFMVSQHPKSITKPKFLHQLHIALKQDIWSEIAFYTKICIYTNYLSYDTFCTVFGAEVWQIPWRVIFSGFGAVTNTWELMTRRKLQNQPKISLHGKCHSSAPIKTTKLLEVPFWRHLAQLSLSIERTLWQISCCSARWSWSSNCGLVMLFEC